jgi:hypothetical protein
VRKLYRINHQQNMNTTLESALYYQRQHFPIFPVSWDSEHKKRKKPLVRWEEFQSRVPTEEEVRRWWKKWPDAGIGMATGRLSRMCAVDAERGADDTLLHLDDCETPIVKSGGDGRHYYFQYDATLGGNRTRFAPLHDFKTEGGYVLLPPSPHESGNSYEWIIPFGEFDPMQIPEQVRRVLAERPRAHVSALLNGTVKKGSRNNSAASVAGSLLARFEPEDWEEQVWPLLQSWNDKHAKPPLPEQELRATFESIAKAQLGKHESKNEEEPKSKSIMQELMKLAQENDTEFFHDDHKEPFVRFRVQNHWEAWPLESRNARRWMQHLYWKHYQRSVRPDSIKQTLGALESVAIFDGKQRKLANRVARTSDKSLWYDLSDDTWRVVRITSEGWGVVQDSPSLFRRYAHQRPQAPPEQGGDPWQLRKFVNTANDQQFLLYLVFVVSCFIPDFPHPIPIVYGSHGAAKTMALRLARLLIDPSITLVPRFPKQQETLIQTLSQNWFTPFDNVDHLSQEASDTICAAITGTGFSKRALYTNDEVFLYAFRRCVGFNGINLVGTNADLLDRSILFQLERIPEDQRRDEAELLREFSDALPGILGGCFDVLAKTLKIHPSVQLPRKPRMADFAIWGYAIAEALGVSGKEFLNAYGTNISAKNEELLDEHPVAVAIMQRVLPGDSWEGNATELHRDLKDQYKELGGDVGAQQFPKNASALSKEINKIRPNLADVGVIVERERSTGKRTTRIRRDREPPVTPVISPRDKRTNAEECDRNMTNGAGNDDIDTSSKNATVTGVSSADDGNDGKFLGNMQAVFPDAELLK